MLTEQASSVVSGGAGNWHVERHEVPGCWEEWGWSKRLEGPVWFIRQFAWNEEGPTLIRFDGVSYFCHIWLNGAWIGSHRGIWTSFEVDVTEAMSDETNVLAVEVFKPWKRFFPVRQSLAGFIPYVTSTFGGIWQRVVGSRRKPVRIVDVYAYYVRDVDVIRIEIHIGADPGVDTAATVRARIGDAERTVDLDRLSSEHKVFIDLPGEGLPHWSPDSPVLHPLTVAVESGGVSETTHRQIGLRTLEARGRRLFFNDEPIYLRGVLHWMSYTDSIAPYWNPERHAYEMDYIRSLGFNLVKQCLVIPPQEYLDHADSTGMLVWIELPMWLPEVDDEYTERTLSEYREIIRRVRNHPSVVLWTLGCELD
ncbi:hypothetical protein KAW64_16545, partial [bacterium]|nr:hypothetical protein [bacterium]